MKRFDPLLNQTITHKSQRDALNKSFCVILEVLFSMLVLCKIKITHLKKSRVIALVETVTLMAIITDLSHKNSSLDNYIAAGTFIETSLTSEFLQSNSFTS